MAKSPELIRLDHEINLTQWKIISLQQKELELKRARTNLLREEREKNDASQ